MGDHQIRYIPISIHELGRIFINDQPFKARLIPSLEIQAKIDHIVMDGAGRLIKY